VARPVTFKAPPTPTAPLPKNVVAGLVVAFPKVKELPFKIAAPVLFPAVKVLAAPEDSVVSPDDVKVVNAPVEAVVAPIAVELIPVAVVLKFPEVNVKLLAPAEMVEADSPDRDNTPEVAVRFTAPVVWVSPLLAVKVPAEVMVPVLVVEMFPLVDSVPASVMVKVGVPPDWMAKEVLVAPLVSLITKAFPVPALVKISEVCSVSPELKVKAMSRSSVVAMVLPAL
jgi:hypothetical protein